MIWIMDFVDGVLDFPSRVFALTEDAVWVQKNWKALCGFRKVCIKCHNFHHGKAWSYSVISETCLESKGSCTINRKRGKFGKRKRKTEKKKKNLSHWFKKTKKSNGQHYFPMMGNLNTLACILCYTLELK